MKQTHIRALLGVSMVVHTFTNSASAQAPSTSLTGADSLHTLVSNMIALCPSIPVADAVLGTRTLRHLPSGTTAGEKLMRSGTQYIAPMTRPLLDAPDVPDLCADPDSEVSGSTNHELLIARDALILATNPLNLPGGATECENLRQETAAHALTVTNLNGIAGLQAPGAVGSTYTMTDWRDVLKIAYLGIHHDAASSQDCNSDVRWSLLSDFRNLSNDGAQCTDGGCGAVTHLWRTDDVSGTTDAFKALLGVSESASYCNGSTSGVYAGDEKDNDPIRRPCQGTPTQVGSDQVCGSDGKLGVVQAISVPAGFGASQIYGQRVCGTLRDLAQVADTTTGPADKCWAGMKVQNGVLIEYGAISQKCVVPLTAGGAFGCRWQSTPVPLIPSAADGRFLNREARDPSTGNLLLYPDNNRPVLNAVFRIRPECQFLTSTEQIGCLASVYPCSAGVAGLPALQVGVGSSPKPISAFRIDGDAPTEANVHANLDASSTGVGYRFSRRIYLNSILDTNGETTVSGWEGGFGDLISRASAISAPQFVKDQAAMVECFKTPSLLRQAVEGNVPVTVGNVTRTLQGTGLLPPLTAVAPHVDNDYAAFHVSCATDK